MSKIDYSEFLPGYPYLDKDIPSQKWLEANMTEAMKSRFMKFFDSSRILFSIPIKNSELLVIEVDVKCISRHQSVFSDLIHRSMPYPVLLLQNYKDEWFKVSIVHSHENQNYSNREVVDERHASAWLEWPDYCNLLDYISSSIDIEEVLASSRTELTDQINDALYYFTKRYLREKAANYFVLCNDFTTLLEQQENPSMLIENVVERYDLILNYLGGDRSYEEDYDPLSHDLSDMISAHIASLNEYLHEYSYVFEDEYTSDDYYRAGSILYETVHEFFANYELLKETTEEEVCTLLDETNKDMQTTVDYLLNYKTEDLDYGRFE